MPEVKSYELEKKIWKNPNIIWDYDAILLLGEEHYLKEDLLAQALTKLNLLKNDGYLKIDADVLKGDELVSILETSSFNEQKQIVIIYNADKIKADVCKKLYSLWSEQGFPESSLPVFLADKVDGRRSLWQLVKEDGIWTKFWQMFEDRLISWTSQRFQLEGIRTTPQATDEMVALCGNDTRKIAREIQKIALVYENQLVNPNIIRQMVTKSSEASKFDIEDRFMMRELPDMLYLINEMQEKIDAREIILSLIRYCRHGLQAQHYLSRRESFAIQLADMGQQIYKYSKVKDWNNISRRNDIMKIAADIINKIPATEKMSWTGQRPLFADEQNDELEVEAEVPEKGKKRSKINFDIEAAEKKAELQNNKKKQQSEMYDTYCHNVWAQRSSVPICKAFAVAAKYTQTELLLLLKRLTRAYYSIWLGEEKFLDFKLDAILLDIIEKKGV